MAKKTPGPFDAIDRILNSGAPQSGNSLMNMEAQGFNNLWFSRAGQYDRAHKGTYGNSRTKELLSVLNSSQLGFKPQISAGYANIGHSDGKGGEHDEDGVFDIGLSGRNSRDAQKLKDILASNGVSFLEEGRGTGNWHLHVRGAGKNPPKIAAQSKQPSYPAMPNAAAFNIPDIPAGAKVVPVDFGFNVPTAQQVQQANVARTKKLSPAPVAMPSGSSQKQEVSTFSAIDNLLADVGKPKPQPQPKEPGFIEGVGNLLNAGGQMLQQIPGAFQKEFESQQSNPIFNQQELMGSALVGALSSPTDLINLATQAPAAIGNAWAGREKYKPLLPELYGVRDIPGLKQLAERHPVGDFIGGAAIPVEGVLGTLAKGGRLGKAAKAAGKTELPTPTRYLDEGLPAPTTEAQMIENIGEMQRRSRPIERLQPAQLDPTKMDAPEVAGQMTQAFKERGGEIPGSVRGNVNAQILGADGRVIETQPTNRLKNSYEAALERSREIDSTLPMEGRSVDVPPSRLPDAPGGPVFREMDSAVKPDPTTKADGELISRASGNVREIGTAKPEILDATGKPINGKPGIVRELEIPGRPKPSNAQLELPTGQGVDMVPGTSKMKELVQDNQMPVPKAGEINKAINDLPTSDQPINPSKPRTIETTQAAQSQGIELMNVADAHEFIKKHQPDQLSHFGNILEAAKNNQTVSVKHRPLDGGGRVENAREIHPVDFGKKTIQGRTEVANLLKEFADGQPNEAAYAAVRDNLVQRLAKNNIQVSAKDQNITGSTPLAIKRKLNALANRLPEHERTHVYVMDHNLESTARGQSYGFRRIDRVTESGLTGKQQAVPEISQYQNKVKPAFDAMRQMAESPDTPTEVSKAIKNITDKGKVNRKDAALMKEWLKNNYSTFCKLFELE